MAALAHLTRQSVYNRLTGYEDVNDAGGEEGGPNLAQGVYSFCQPVAIMEIPLKIMSTTESIALSGRQT